MRTPFAVSIIIQNKKRNHVPGRLLPVKIGTKLQSSNLKFTIKALQPSKMNKQAFAVCSFFTVTVIKKPAFFAFVPFREDMAFCSGAGVIASVGCALARTFSHVQTPFSRKNAQHEAPRFARRLANHGRGRFYARSQTRILLNLYVTGLNLKLLPDD
jgi:hypothetical protein